MSARIDFGYWFMWAMLLLPTVVGALAVAAWLGGPL